MASTLTRLLYHVVFSTRGRRGLIDAEFRPRLHAYLAAIICGEGGEAIAVGGTRDHVHLLARFPASVPVSEMMRRIKGNSSRWAGQRRRFGWQRGYGAFSVSESQADRVADYVASQEEHHRRASFEEESLSLLRKHRVDYDGPHVFD